MYESTFITHRCLLKRKIHFAPVCELHAGICPVSGKVRHCLWTFPYIFFLFWFINSGNYNFMKCQRLWESLLVTECPFDLSVRHPHSSMFCNRHQCIVGIDVCCHLGSGGGVDFNGTCLTAHFPCSSNAALTVGAQSYPARKRHNFGFTIQKRTILSCVDCSYCQS